MHRYFGPEGLLARKVEHFEFRPSQMQMAEAVFDCLTSGTPLLAEAGTGTGKTWAYLIPAILSNRKVIVSTGTKTLQDQILDRDIPLLRRLVAPRLQAVCLKGRRNYLCRRRFRDFAYQPTFWNREEAKLFARIKKWAARTQTGDRTEIAGLPDQFQAWNEICSSSDHCIGQKCDDHARCFLTRLRNDASRAQLLVVNHHLFFADLALRDRNSGEVIPEYDAVIFDEAHRLEDVVGLYFGIHFGSLQLMDLLRDVQKECRRDQKKVTKFQEVLRTSQQLEPLSRLLYQYLAQPRGVRGRFALDPNKAGKDFLRICREASHALERLAALLTPLGEGRPAFEPLSRRCLELSFAAREIIEQSDSSLVYWYEVTQQGVFIQGTPIEVGSILRKRLFEKKHSVAMTSATLSVAGAFDFLRQSLAVPEGTREAVFPSPFVFEKQALLYVPSEFPAPQEPEFCSAMAAETLEILKKTNGRALLLFTSYRNMHEVYKQIKDSIPYPHMIQGEKPKRALLGEFRENIDSVLFATSSFWQGIDVPGEALSCLIIDKLPFEVPDDPLISARMNDLASRGLSPFFSYQVPRAVIQLKQGVGRLIRSSSDRGVIVIFDVRLHTKSYGRIFMKSLPPCRIARKIESIDAFLASNDFSDCAGSSEKCPF